MKPNRIFIGGHRKSGTTLCLSLLDGHPDLWVYPYETHFWYSWYPEYAQGHTEEEKKDRIKSFIFKDLEHILYKFCNIIIDVKQLELRFEHYLGDRTSTKAYFDSMVDTVASLQKIYEPVHSIITKDTHSEIYVNEIFKLYPDAKFINIVRDPRDNCASLLSGWDKHYQYQYDCKERLFRDFIDRGLLCLSVAFENRAIYGKDRYLIIRYEDIIANPEHMMKGIAHFIGVDPSKLNLTPTFFGIDWKGNSFVKDHNGIDTSRVGIYRKDLSEYHKRVVEYYFAGLMLALDYNLDYTPQEMVDAVREHYKWFNANQIYSGKGYRKYE